MMNTPRSALGTTPGPEGSSLRTIREHPMSVSRSFLGTFFVVSGLIVCGSETVVAQYGRSLSIHGGMGLTTTSYDERAAERSNTVRRGFGLQGFVEPRLYDTVGLPVMIGWEYLGPICFDANETTRCAGRNERRTSLLFASLGAAMYGPSIPWPGDEGAPRRRAFIIAGREWVSRGIDDDDCLNCMIDDVHFDGGLFVEPGIELPAGRQMVVALGYRMYRGSSDLENRFVIRLISEGGAGR